MTPKEKAKDLFTSYELLYPFNYDKDGTSFFKSEIKRCALIAVEEIIKSNPALIKFNSIELDDNYWQEVRQEIENL